MGWKTKVFPSDSLFSSQQIVKTANSEGRLYLTLTTKERKRRFFRPKARLEPIIEFFCQHTEKLSKLSGTFFYVKKKSFFLSKNHQNNFIFFNGEIFKTICNPNSTFLFRFLHNIMIIVLFPWTSATRRIHSLSGKILNITTEGKRPYVKANDFPRQSRLPKKK